MGGFVDVGRTFGSSVFQRGNQVGAGRWTVHRVACKKLVDNCHQARGQRCTESGEVGRVALKARERSVGIAFAEERNPTG